MSEQVSISAGFCILAMAAFALFAEPLAQAPANVTLGAEAFASAPAGFVVPATALMRGG